VRVAQPQRVGTQEHRCRHTPGPIQRERVHRLQHAVFDRVEQLEVADHVLGAERLERQFAAGSLDHVVGPLLKGLEAVAAGPRCLNFPRRRLRLGRADIGHAKMAGSGNGADRAAGDGRALDQATARIRLGRANGFLRCGLLGHRMSSPVFVRAAAARLP